MEEMHPAANNAPCRVAFFGGSFDPPHRGHLAIARAAVNLVGLDRVLFAPVGVQPFKSVGLGATFDQRVAMTQLAINNQPGFELSLLDAPAQNSPDAPPNYSAETLERLRANFPSDSQLYCLIGADSLRSLSRWHRAQELLFLATFIVASRPGEDIHALNALLPAGNSLRTPKPQVEANGQLQRWLIQSDAGKQGELIVLPELEYEVSATALREEIQNSSKCKTEHSKALQLLPATVLEFILTHHLYR